MARPPALVAAQEKQLRARVKAGADLPGLQAFAEKKEWKVSRTVLAELLKDERGRLAEGLSKPAGPPGSPEELADVVADMRQEIAGLRARLDGLLTLPKVKLSEAANAAVHVAQGLLSLPNSEVDARAKAAIMAQLPDLIDAARKALEAEQQGNADEDLGI